MKLELNYDCKTITVKDQINLKEFIKEVKKLGLDLKEWNVISDTIWTTYPIYPTYPYYQQPYIFTTGDITTADCHGTTTDTVQITSVWCDSDIKDIKTTLTTNC